MLCLHRYFSVPVKIKPFTGNITVNETNPIDLRCEASGYPAPTITWIKDGRLIHSRSVFRIERSSRIHSGVYVCIANNTVGTAEMEIFVSVYCKYQKGSYEHISWCTACQTR